MSEMWLLGKRETEEGAELYQEEYRKLMAKTQAKAARLPFSWNAETVDFEC